MDTIPFLDLQAQYRTIRSEIASAIESVLETSQYVLGPYVKAFEEKFAAMHQSTACVGTNNGTSALHLALWALGIQSGDEVIVPVNTFIATAEAVVLCGAIPVFADHDEFYNIDPEDVERKITAKTRAVIAVHLYGQPARMTELKAIADAKKLLLIEDAAQAHLGEFESQLVGAWGVATCFSFYPGKNLGAYGEAGAVNTSDQELASAMRILRDHGSKSKYNHTIVGHNYRMEALQGAVLETKLPHLQEWTDRRRKRAAIYSKNLSGLVEVQIPCVHPNANPVWHLYVIRCKRRDELQKHLNDRGIATGLHYPVPLNRQPAFAYLNDASSYPNSDHACGEILSLPMFPELTEAQILRVCDEIRSFYLGD
jgi:dTDP-4-amino-4,6-dideoxygalactose transaminase